MNRTICDFTQVAYNLSSIINLGFWAFERAFRCNLFALEKSKKDFHYNP